MERQYTGITVAGTVIVDKINEISAYPACGELTQIRSVHPSVGGCVPNVALDLKQLDPSLPVFAVGTVGSDEEGDFVRSTLEKGGVDTTGLTVLPGEKTSFTQVMSIPGGQRTFFTYAGASAAFGSEHIGDNCPKLLHLGYFLLLERVDNGEGLRILQNAKQRGIETSIDLVSENSDRYALVTPCLPYTDYLIINEMEAGKLTAIDPAAENLEKIARRLKEMGVRKKVIIHQPDRSVCLSDEGFTCVPSYSLPDGFIKGTTGAGDAFCAGVAAAMTYGKTLAEAVEIGTMLAASVITSTDNVCPRFQPEELGIHVNFD